jgi:hypothetical protein
MGRLQFMEFEERFPRFSKAARLCGATFVPLVLMLVPFAVFVGSWRFHGDPANMHTFSIMRLYLLLAATALALGFGAVAGEIAFPHSVLVPALLVAAVVLLNGSHHLIDELIQDGELRLTPFVYAAVGPPAFVLGALLRHRWLKRKRAG